MQQSTVLLFACARANWQVDRFRSLSPPYPLAVAGFPPDAKPRNVSAGLVLGPQRLAIRCPRPGKTTGNLTSVANCCRSFLARLGASCNIAVGCVRARCPSACSCNAACPVTTLSWLYSSRLSAFRSGAISMGNAANYTIFSYAPNGARY